MIAVPAESNPGTSGMVTGAMASDSSGRSRAWRCIAKWIDHDATYIKQFDVTKELLRMLGLESDRVRLEWVSAAEGPRWAALIDEFVTQITALGPSPWHRAAPVALTGDIAPELEVGSP